MAVNVFCRCYHCGFTIHRKRAREREPCARWEQVDDYDYESIARPQLLTRAISQEPVSQTVCFSPSLLFVAATCSYSRRNPRGCLLWCWLFPRSRAHRRVGLFLISFIILDLSSFVAHRRDGERYYIIDRLSSPAS